MEYIRTIKDGLFKAIGKKPIIILYGARQVGKTTLVKNILKSYPKSLYLQGDDPRDALRLENKGSTELISLLSGHDLVVIDEAQQIKNIGTSLKLIADNIPAVQVIATGSSSFELANKLNEPLTGRNRKFTLFPLSIPELITTYGKRKIEDNLIEYITFGMYPEVVSAKSIDEKKEALVNLATDYLFKDIFKFSNIKNSFVFEKIVRLLALRVGSEISYNELAKEVGINRDTLYGYITLLEQSFIVFRLIPLYTNKTKEINKNHKIYFYDTGIRNAVLRAFDPLDLRSDKGAVFENFFIAEMIKRRAYNKDYTDINFWRNRQSGEVDFIESHLVESDMPNAVIEAYECKWSSVSSVPTSFTNLYPQAHFHSVNIQNLIDTVENRAK